ncbi:MAG: GNAT family N-acetyltransferase [Geminicoccaceae bacterium]
MICTVEPRKITYDNVDELIDLVVRDDQTHLVAPNSLTIAQASYMPDCWTRGLWVAGVPVGLIAMIDLHENHPEADDYAPADVAFLWRLMIDGEHQGRGYGSQAIDLAFNQARQWRRERLYLSVARGDGNALAFYKRFGLESTGQVHGDELVLSGTVPKG